MATNVTPQYQKAEQRYKQAKTNEEKLDALQEMLREVPKHKSSENLQAEIKTRMKKVRAAMSDEAKKPTKTVDLFHVPKSGGGQLALIGTPNCGKSAILAVTTKAPVTVAEYPFSSDKPVPGMMVHEDVPIQIVDVPPISADYAAPGLVNLYRNTDLIGIVIDLSADPLEELEVCTAYLDSHRLILDEATGGEDEQGHKLARPTFVIATKADLAPEGTLETVRELTDRSFEYLEISSETGDGMDAFKKRVFEMLDIVRVYAKKPGKPVEMKDPFVLKNGSNVYDLAQKVHRQLAEKLKSARAWNSPLVYDGQSVHNEHLLSDKEIVELHFG